MGWVNVNDRLPEYGKDVIIYTTSGCCYKGHLVKQSEGCPPVWLVKNYSVCDFGLPLYWKDDSCFVDSERRDD